MRVLDLFCGAGGASVGLHRAGFEIYGGIDIIEQPNYPFDFYHLDALKSQIPANIDFIWASPPCQAFTSYKRRPNHVFQKPDLIPIIRDILKNWGGYYCIENVPKSPLQNPIQLCGSSFGLDIRRHRLFECNFQIIPPKCNHSWQQPRFPPATNRKNLRSTVEIGVWRIPLKIQQKAMGIDWMNLAELSQAVPPAYAKFIGDTLKHAIC